MSNYLRPRVAGASVFFTVCLAEKGGRLLLDEIEALRRCVRRVRTKRPFRIDAWVVMPDHMHAVWTLPVNDSNYSERWGAIKSQFTMAMRRPGFSPAPPLPTELPLVTQGRYAGLKPGLRTSKREQPIWQRRFWEHHLQSQSDVTAAIRYCWTNPVKHGFVERPEDWLYSSVHRDRRLGQYAA